MPELIACGLLFTFTALVGALATWFARGLSHRTGILDHPGERKVHVKPIAYLGGLGMVFATLLGLALMVVFDPFEVAISVPLLTAVVLGLLAIFLVGLWDDVVGMKPLVKLGAQILVALGLWIAGVRIERVAIFSTPTELMGGGEGDLIAFVLASLPSILLTVGWYAALMNAINLIDGLDGLAGGVSFIAALTLGAVALIVPHNGMALGVALPFIAAGAILGFLFHNWHPAKIFMGDAGSMSLGYLLATAALVGSTKSPALLTLLLPLVALGLPLFETAFSFIRRILTGQSPFKADRRHLHHRLLDAGLDQQRVVLVFLYVTLFLGLNSILLAKANSALLLLNVIYLGVGMLMLIEYLAFTAKRRELREAAEREKSASAAPPAPAQPLTAIENSA
ncbi:MAG: MraY family glycosyltransferase [Sumerlaeia bacterium]